MNGYQKKSAVQEFISWVNEQRELDQISPEALDAWVASFTECDVVFCYGRGHQSVAFCGVTGRDHTYHEYHDLNSEDGRMSDQTYARKGDGKVFRIILHDKGWY